MLLTQYAGQYLEEYEAKRAAPSYWVGPLAFFPELDERMYGLARKEVTLLSGSAGTGKSALALYLTWRNYLEGTLGNRQAVLYASAEMNLANVVGRIISQMTGIPGWRLRTGMFEEGERFRYDMAGANIVQRPSDPADMDAEVRAALELMAAWPIAIYDEAILTTMDLEREVKRLHADGYDVPLVVVDHFGRLSDEPPDENGAEKHQYKMVRLDRLAREYDLHVLAIHEQTMQSLRDTKPPRETDLKGGASSNYDPHNILMLWSPDKANGESDLDIIDVEVWLRKNKNGGGPGFGGTYPFAMKAGYYGVAYEAYPETQRRYAGYQVPFVVPRVNEKKEALGDTYGDGWFNEGSE